MSGYLATLVSRNAGLAPAVLARPVDAAPGIEAPPAGAEVHDGDAAPPHPVMPSPVMGPRDALAPVPSPIVHDAPATPLAPAPLPATTTIVQRLVLPAAAPAAPVPTPAAVAAPIAAVPVPRGPVERIVTPDAPLPVRNAGVPPVIDAGRERADERPTSHGDAPHAELRMAAAPAPAPRDIELVPARIIETVRDVERPTAAIAPPAPVPLAAAIERPAAEPMVTPERVVHVRIGAIEIHGAPAAAAPPAARPDPATIAPPAEAGFDRFARLRRYAAWEG